MRSKSSPELRDWEWVYTGAEFARSHKLSKSHGAVWFIIALVALQFAGTIWGMALGIWHGMLGFWMLVLGIISIPLSLLTLWTLLSRNPAAWFLTWVHLVFALPISVPLMFYWADGRRPNLVYRHRFERLVPLPEDKKEEPADV